MPKKLTVSHTFFSAVADIVYQRLGLDHPCSQFFMKAYELGTEEDMRVAMDAVRLLPTAQREHILSAAHRKLNEEARLLKWVMAKVDLPTDIPPTATRH